MKRLFAVVIIPLLLMFCLAANVFSQESAEIVSTTPVGGLETSVETKVPNYDFAFGLRAGFIQPFGDISDYLSGGFSSSLFVRYNPNLLKGLSAELEVLFHPMPITDTDAFMNTFGVGLGPRYSFKLASFFYLSLYTNYGVMFNLSRGVASGNEMFTNFLFKGGVSFDFEIAYHSALCLDISYQTAFEPSSVQGLIVAASYAFQIGGKQRDTQLQIAEPTVNAIFPSLYSTYKEDRPAGFVTITNTGDTDIENMQVSLYISDYMDNPTVAASGLTLNPDDSEYITLYAVFNENIMTNETDKTVVAQIIFRYDIAGTSYTKRETVPFTLHNKNALTWDDLNKVAAFVSPDDPAIRILRSKIETDIDDPGDVSFINSNIKKAMRAFAALKSFGLEYLSDPNKPFATSGSALDTAQYPAQFLSSSNSTGDCDDFTILYSSLLEAVGVEAGFIITSSHIFTMFNTGVPEQSKSLISENQNAIIVIDGSIWIPVETTFLDSDRENFTEAWEMALQEYQSNINDAELIKVHEAWITYPPVHITDFDASNSGIDLSSANSIYEQQVLAYRTNHKSSLDRAMTAVQYAQNLTKEEKRDAAIELIRNNQPAPAINFLEEVVSEGDSSYEDYYYLATAYLQSGEDYQAAIDNFLNASENITGLDNINRFMPRIYLNIAQCHKNLGNTTEQIDYYNRANDMNPVLARRFAFLSGEGEEGTARADEDGEIIPLLLD